MGSVTEEFAKVNGYSLAVRNDLQEISHAYPSLIRIFNFKSRQVFYVSDNRGGEGVASSFQKEKFSDLDSLDEVIFMHRKLLDLGGSPPPLDEITRHHGKTIVNVRPADPFTP